MHATGVDGAHEKTVVVVVLVVVVVVVVAVVVLVVGVLQVGGVFVAVLPTNVAVPLSSSAPGPASPAVVSMMLDPVAASQNVAASTLLAAVADGVWLGTQHGVVPSLAQQS